MSESLKAETEEQVLDTIKWAVAERKSLDVRGTGSKSKLGRPMKLDHVLDLSALYRYLIPPWIVNVLFLVSC